MHVYHESLGCPEGTILYDGCEECEERSRQGLAGLCHMDQDRVEALWRRMLVTEGREADPVEGHQVDKGYLTDAEARLGKELYYLAILLERAGRPFMQGLFY